MTAGDPLEVGDGPVVFHAFYDPAGGIQPAVAFEVAFHPYTWNFGRSYVKTEGVGIVASVKCG